MPAIAPDIAAPGTLKEKVRRLPDRPGVYLMKDRLGRVIYVGKAKSLKKRVSSYFQKGRGAGLHPKIRMLISLIADVDTMTVKSEPEALLLEGRLIKQWKPRYNTDFTDDKHFLLVRVDPGEALPRFRLSRFRKDDRSRYFGPFAHSGLLRKTLNEMRRQFGILLGDTNPRQLPDGRWELYDDVRQELSGFPNIVSAADYRRRTDDAAAFLEGKSREWLDAMQREMAAAATAQQFEKAAELRDVMFALRSTLARTRRFERGDPTAVGANETATRMLGEALGPARASARRRSSASTSRTSRGPSSSPRWSGVRRRPAPDKEDQYRRFQIKSFVGNDDFRAMEEVVGRRYRRLRDEGRPFPDLVVIDGGAGQVGAASSRALPRPQTCDAAPAHRAGQEARDGRLPRRPAGAQPAAGPSGAPAPAAAARRGAPLRQHLQCGAALSEDSGVHPRRFPGAGPGPARRPPRAFWRYRPDPRRQPRGAPRGARLRPEAGRRAPAISVAQERRRG